MIYIFGDSHARFSFMNLSLPHKNLYTSSYTMFRIGRDNILEGFKKEYFNSTDILCFAFGEVDCRCHINKQIALGRNEDEIIQELVSNYFRTINNNLIPTKIEILNNNNRVIIVGVIPPIKKDEYESINGPIKHSFPILGTDDERVRFTRKVNKKIEELCKVHSYSYFNPYSEYEDLNGNLRFEVSDTLVHLKKNEHFLHKFNELYQNIINTKPIFLSK